MKKATNINELANNLLPERVLDLEDKNVYEPIYQDKLKKLRSMIINDEDGSQTFFAAGQPGTGKTTALNFFLNDSINDHYHVKYMNMRDFLDLSDVDVIDFLLAFAFALIDGTGMEDEYYEKLVEIQKVNSGEMEIFNESECTNTSSVGASGELSAQGSFFNFVKLRARAFFDLKIDKTHREKTREIFRMKKTHLKDLVNNLLNDYSERLPERKRLLVIIDDLDKMRKSEQINSLFLENRNYIFPLKCKKIISIPMHLTRMSEITNCPPDYIIRFILRLSPNPISLNSKANEGKKIITNRNSLRMVILNRIADDVTLIDDEALDFAINKSGGIIRQLVTIVRVAAVNVRANEETKITLGDVIESIDILRNDMAGTIITNEKINMLYTILIQKVPESEESALFVELIQSNNVVAYENGEPWYEVNPLIQNTVKIYAERKQEKKSRKK